MTNRILLSGGSSCSTEMVGGKRRKYHKKSMKRHGTRKSRRHSRKMMKKGVSRKSRRHSRKMMKKGGSRKSRRHSRKMMKKGGSRKSRRHLKKMMKKGGSRKSRGAGMVQRAALPFGLLALQKMMHRRKSRKSFKKFGKKVLKTPYKTAKFLL
jgi:hypothetical protein